MLYRLSIVKRKDSLFGVALGCIMKKPVTLGGITG
jgi:hypothetical protein